MDKGEKASMIRKGFNRCLLQFVLLICILFFSVPALLAVEAEKGGYETGKFNAIVAYSGMYTTRTFGDAVSSLPGDMENNYIHALGLNRRLFEWPAHFTWEGEVLFAKHHGRHDNGRQSYEEYCACLLLRYHYFPWNKYVDTTIAFGEGLSCTSKLSIREEQYASGTTRRLLNYLTVEVGGALPRYPDWSLVYRIHHRSGIFGLMGGIKGVSDYYSVGLRYRF